MAINELAIKSYDEIIELLLEKALEHYNDKDWAGLKPYSLERLLAEVVAEASTLNGTYLDLRAREAFLDTAQVYRDVLRIANNIRSISSRKSRSNHNASTDSNR